MGRAARAPLGPAAHRPALCGKRALARRLRRTARRRRNDLPLYGRARGGLHPHRVALPSAPSAARARLPRGPHPRPLAGASRRSRLPLVGLHAGGVCPSAGPYGGCRRAQTGRKGPRRRGAAARRGSRHPPRRAAGHRLGAPRRLAAHGALRRRGVPRVEPPPDAARGGGLQAARHRPCDGAPRRLGGG